MKKVVSLLIVLVFLCGCSVMPKETKPAAQGKISAVWIYFSELSMKSESGGTKKSFTEKMNVIFDNCVKMGINTVFVQVRPCCDAFYKSEIFPWSYYVTGTQGKSVDYDPLQIMVELAHKNNLSIHAWINPFRVAFSDDKSLLSEDNPALSWMNSDDKDLNRLVVSVNGGLYFSPPSDKVQKLILDGVRELVNNYDIDGIHIDDYFYPSIEEKVDSSFYKEYTDNGGALSLSEWRLTVISAFISSMYSAVKSCDSKCIFSISPAGNITNNYNQQFADVKLWCSQRGYADWIIPQVYYGFDDKKLTFDAACDQWSKLDTVGAVKMIYGIAAYKVNESDDEWTAGSGIIDKQISYAKSKDNYYGTAFFSYSSLIDKDKSAEFQNISALVLS
jgi:uncharacterized lipoprotein YddW (UPF0748 family)